MVPAIPYDTSCYSQSTKLAGNRDGNKVTDLTAIDNEIQNLAPQYRSAAIKTCYLSDKGNPNNGDLLGHQIAIANYDTITGQLSNKDLFWLPGLGTTTQTTKDNIKCDIYYM